jgi:hypothetical protein
VSDVEIQIRGGTELRRITRGLRRMDNRELLTRFRRELRAAVAPAVPRVRASITAIPTSGTQSTGLRRRLAKATRLEVRTTGRDASVAVRVDGRKMPDGQGSLPAAMEGSKPWWHPVYGNRGAGVRQPAHPYFYRVMRGLGPESRRAIGRVLDDITKIIS